MKRFYSVKDLADASGYSPGTIQNRISEGVIFAVQGAKRGAYRIPASSYLAYLSTLGMAPIPEVELLHPSIFEVQSSAQIYQDHVAPDLIRSGYPDMPALLRAAEVDPELYVAYRDAIHTYTTFLARRAEEARAMVPA